MATDTAADGDDGQPRLTDEQQAALLRAMSTPALTASLERMQSRFRSIAEQVNGSVGRTVASQLEPVLKASRIQTSIGEGLRPLIEQQLRTRRLMEPMLAQIAAQQQQWAEKFAVPLMANVQLQEQMAGMLLTPQLTDALQRINEIARVHLDFPDMDGIDRVSGLIDSGEIDATTLETAEAGVGSDVDMVAAIEEAAEVLARERPWMSRERARQVVLVWVWLMWTAGLVAIAVAAPPIVGTIAGAAGLAGSKDVAKKAGEKFDKRFPPKDEPEPAHD
jgi:hypothetical protein